MVEKALTPMETFQEKVREKIRTDIAEMLPSEAIDEMVKRVINEEFFTKRRVQTSRYGQPEEIPSLFQEMVTEAAKPLIEKAVQRTIVAHGEAIEATINNAIQSGLLRGVFTTLEGMISDRLFNFGQSIVTTVKEDLRGGLVTE